MPSNYGVLELTSVEMRRRIGSKEISPVELHISPIPLRTACPLPVEADMRALAGTPFMTQAV
jgi:hypothetical protein